MAKTELSGLLLRIYKAIYEAREIGEALTIDEIRAKTEVPGAEQQQLDRRVRTLRERGFDIPCIRNGARQEYVLRGYTPKVSRDPISNTLRARILAPQRCAQCGRNPLEDRVKLHVDHKIPQEWGGTNDEDNLQPLCSDCNEGKRNFYATLDGHSDKVVRAVQAGPDDVHRRIATLLVAFNGEPVPADLIRIVAGMGTKNSSEWDRRLRELRDLGWVITVKKKKVDGRFMSEYTVINSPPLPQGRLADAVHAAAKRRR